MFNPVKIERVDELLAQLQWRILLAWPAAPVLPPATPAEAAPAPVDPAWAQQPAAPSTDPTQTPFPGGYPADFARDAAQADPSAPAATPAQPPEQILPPAAQGQGSQQ